MTNGNQLARKKRKIGVSKFRKSYNGKGEDFLIATEEQILDAITPKVKMKNSGNVHVL